MNENDKDIESNKEVKIIYVYLPRKHPPSKLKYIKRYQSEHPEKLKEYRGKYESKKLLQFNKIIVLFQKFIYSLIKLSFFKKNHFTI